MNELLIYKTLEKMALAGLDVDYYIGNLMLFQENVWFAPNNNNSNDFSICDHLSQLHLIEKCIVPNWTKDGLFRGLKIMFKYRTDLQYQTS